MTRFTALRRSVMGLAFLLFGSASAMAGPPAVEGDLAPPNSFQECDVCPEMIVLPLGAFTMGGPNDDLATKSAEAGTPAFAWCAK
ncbi:MAG: hypothetical protein AAGE76_12340 [Pseudomonadota bacterium]